MTSHRRPKRAQRAFSLVETVIAMGVFAAIATWILTTHAFSLQTATETRHDQLIASVVESTTRLLRSPVTWHVSGEAAGPIMTALIGSESLESLAASPEPVSREAFFTAAGTVAESASNEETMYWMRARFIPAPNLAQGIDAPGLHPNLLGSVESAANLVRVDLEVRYPALAPEPEQNSRYFSTIIARPAR